MPFEPWGHRALDKWPNVPALYGWLPLDRHGRWRIRGETISGPQIIDTDLVYRFLVEQLQ